MLSHDREVWFLYNGFLMDDVGDTMQGQPHAFPSLNDAKEWAARQDMDIEIKAGSRKGDRIEERTALDASGNPRKPIDPSKLIFVGTAPRALTKDDQNAIDELAMRFFEGSGDAMAVSHSIRNVILARFEWVKKHGKDAGD